MNAPRPVPRSLRLALALLLATATFAGPAALAQECVGDITVVTQAEVDAVACTSVTGTLSIETASGTPDPIVSLSGLAGITSVGGSLHIEQNVALTSLTGLDNIASVSGLFLSDNAVLASLDGLAGLTSVGGVTIQQNDALLSLDGLSGLTSVEVLFIGNNGVLASLDGLAGLTSVSDMLTITGNDALTSLDGLSGISSSLARSLSINFNDALESLEGLAGISSVGLALEISDNDALTSLDGLDNISSVGGSLEITDNDVLTSLDGLAGISSSVRDVFIRDNGTLTSLDGLAGVTSVTSNAFIFGNAALTSLDGLDNISSVGGELFIAFNEQLTACACGLIGLISGDPPAFTGVSGSVSISGNAPSGQCTSPEVVLEASLACTPVANEPSAGGPAAITLDAAYPNPFAGSVTLGFEVPEATEVRLELYDALGRGVAVLDEGLMEVGRHTEVFDGRSLPSGVYIVRLTAAGGFAQTRQITFVR